MKTFVHSSKREVSHNSRGDDYGFISSDTVTNDCPDYRRIPKSSSSAKLISIQELDSSYESENNCNNCGHSVGNSTMPGTLPISPLATSNNQLASTSNSDELQQNLINNSSAHGSRQALMPMNRHPGMRRNESSISMGTPMDDMLISRRPSVLLQEILSAQRPSLVLATLRGPSMNQNQRNARAMGLVNIPRSLHENAYSGSAHSMNTERNYGNDHERGPHSEMAMQSKLKNRRIGDDALSTALSALYCKLMVIMGVSMPITEIVSDKIPTVIYQSFYVYLYCGSILFVCFQYATTLKNKAVFNIIKDYHEKANHVHLKRKAARYGSFYLRVGAIAFAIGTMVYSGLEFGQYFELNGQAGCRDVFVAVTPICRMILCIIQVQFIFLNTTDLDMAKHKVISRFGLMHMVATNLCEWLYVLVEETKHEIFHFSQHNEKSSHTSNLITDTLSKMVIVPVVSNLTEIIEPNLNMTMAHNSSAKYISLGHHLDSGCSRTNIMGALVQEVSPFLFPCTIEYSLICAVILYEMWKKVKSIPDIAKNRKDSVKASQKSAHHFSVDCSQSHKGLFFGILIIVMTIISMIMYFVLYDQPGLQTLATKEVTLWETVVYAVTSAAIIAAMIRMRDLKFLGKAIGDHHSMNLDCTLLVLAQTGVYVYAMFSIMGSYFSSSEDVPDRVEGIISEVFGLFQTSIQTLFVLNACQRRAKGAQQQRQKPGREIITFLIVANVSMWFINTLIKGRAIFRNSHMVFFGVWAWTIITHVSMPLAIFYRFHSTICLFEIWKSAYKIKTH